MSDNPLSSIRTKVASAAEVLSPTWPIDTFIAVNHASGLNNKSFAEAIRTLRTMLEVNGLPSKDYFAKQESLGKIRSLDLEIAMEESASNLKHQKRLHSINDLEPNSVKIFNMSDILTEILQVNCVDSINKEMQKWCAAYFDKGTAAWKMPYKSEGLFIAWKKLATTDIAWNLKSFGFKKRIEELPTNSNQALLFCLRKLSLEDREIETYLRRHIMQMPGWPCFILNRQENPERQQDSHALMDYLVIRLFYEYETILQYVTKKKIGLDFLLTKYREKQQYQFAKSDSKVESEDIESRLRLLESLEINYRNNLLAKLFTNLPVVKRKVKPKAQLVFCIDARSEGLRRHIESLDSEIQTIGFAGFFGFPINFRAVDNNSSAALCPVLIKPKYTISYRSVSDRLKKWLSVSFADQLLRTILHDLRNNLLFKFYFAEAAGIWCLPLSLTKTLCPLRLSHAKKIFNQKKEPPAQLAIDLSPEDDFGMPLNDRILYSEAVLRAMSLVDDFAPLIVLVGHGSSSENNPYESALDCGACGGNTGALSARIAATIFNQKEVRAGLLSRGIKIPTTTLFLAAQHNTTTDDVTFSDQETIPSESTEDLINLKTNLDLASQALRCERECAFIQNEGKSAFLRAIDWSQTRPEWGLAKNAAFIAGPRELTYGLDLDRRAFLHEYNEQTDSNNKILELIMTAPLVVAQWINMQYYFSTVDPQIFGAGSKTTQNIVSNIGVMRGAQSDLQLGLPWESIAENSDNFFHEPLRLLAIFCAKRENIDHVLLENESVAALIVNEWVKLLCIENNKFYRFIRIGVWEEVEVKQLVESSST